MHPTCLRVPLTLSFDLAGGVPGLVPWGFRATSGWRLRRRGSRRRGSPSDPGNLADLCASEPLNRTSPDTSVSGLVRNRGSVCVGAGIRPAGRRPEAQASGFAAEGRGGAAVLPIPVGPPHTAETRMAPQGSAGPLVEQGIGGWRCRESNPGPSLAIRVFSGRSLLCVSRPRQSRRQAVDGLSHCLLSCVAP